MRARNCFGERPYSCSVKPESNNESGEDDNVSDIAPRSPIRACIDMSVAKEARAMTVQSANKRAAPMSRVRSYGPPSKRLKNITSTKDRVTKTKKKELKAGQAQPGIPFLMTFLSTCNPSLERHSKLFINYGPYMDWEAMLRSLSLDWSVEDQKALVRDILAGKDKVVAVMEIDVTVFENNLKRYFV